MLGSRAETIALRLLSIALMLFSLAFGITWGKEGYCLGDDILARLGLKAWSNGTQGTHYAALYALALLLVAFALYAATMDKQRQSFTRLVVGSAAGLALANILFFAI